MYSPSIHSLLARARIDELTGAAAICRRTRSANRRPRRVEGGAEAPPTRHRSTYRFLRHYAEMVAVMFAGMFALMAPSDALLGALGTSSSRLSSAMSMFEMALTMTLPMVAWMRYRGHAWRPNLEMAASMLIPTFAVMGLLSAGVGASGSLMVPEHVGMLSCMLVAMLYRRDEYSRGTHHGQAARNTLRTRLRRRTSLVQTMLPAGGRDD